jgi:hypothetical protein
VSCFPACNWVVNQQAAWCCVSDRYDICVWYSEKVLGAYDE